MKADFPSTWKFNKIGDDAFEVLDGAGKKWGTVYKDKIVCPARTQIGTAGNPIINRLELIQKNMNYEVDGIIYKTDDLGRVLTTNADLDDIARVRLGNQQIKAVDVKDGVRGVDQGGHIVGSRFFGPGEQINLYPQSANLNQGAWKTMENSWANAMVNGSDVKIEVEAVFSGISKRPDSFKVKYTIDGQPFQENFINQ
jgi:DNA/RNA non-specific endonuclease